MLCTLKNNDWFCAFYPSIDYMMVAVSALSSIVFGSNFCWFLYEWDKIFVVVDCTYHVISCLIALGISALIPMLLLFFTAPIYKSWNFLSIFNTIYPLPIDKKNILLILLQQCGWVYLYHRYWHPEVILSFVIMVFTLFLLVLVESESLFMIQEEDYISCTMSWWTSQQVLDRRKPDMAGELTFGRVYQCSIFLYIIAAITLVLHIFFVFYEAPAL